MSGSLPFTRMSQRNSGVFVCQDFIIGNDSQRLYSLWQSKILASKLSVWQFVRKGSILRDSCCSTRNLCVKINSYPWQVLFTFQITKLSQNREKKYPRHHTETAQNWIVCNIFHYSSIPWYTFITRKDWKFAWPIISHNT